MATRRDVALKANVSPATVTNVYNQSKYVSPEIRKKVFEAAKELGYMQEESMEFAFLCDDPSNPHNIEILEGLCATATEHNVFVSMIPFSNNLNSICDTLIKKRFSGVFISHAFHDIPPAIIKKLEKNNVVVSSSWHDFQVDFPSIPITMVDFLVNLGHKKICYLTNRSLTDCSYKNFEKAIKKHNLPFSTDMIISGSFPYKADCSNGYSAVKNAILGGKDFTAIVSTNDLMAMGAIRALTELGISVPNDVSIISCDDIPIAEFSNPPLTTVHLPAKSLGKICMTNMILRKLGETPSVSHTNLNIIVRGTSAPPKKK